MEADGVPPNGNVLRAFHLLLGAWNQSAHFSETPAMPLKENAVFGQVLEPGRRRMTAVVRALAPVSLLEVGVGTGLALAGYPSTADIVGIDLSQEMLARAREQVLAHDWQVLALESVNLLGLSRLVVLRNPT